MNFQEFEFIDFNPRVSFKNQATLILNDILREFPMDTRYQAVCTFYSKLFFIQIKIFLEDSEIHAQCILDPSKNKMNSRDWQVESLFKIKEDLLSQIEKTSIAA